MVFGAALADPYYELLRIIAARSLYHALGTSCASLESIQFSFLVVRE